MAYINESHIEDADIKFFLKNLKYDEHINAWKDELVGRDSLKEVVLKKRLFKIIEKLNPNIPQECLYDAIEQLTISRVSQSEIKANSEVYELLKDGYYTSYKNEEGKDEPVQIKFIGFDKDSIHNEFLVVSQLTIEKLSSTGKRRPDILLYVNGLPLVMIELKRPDIKVKTGYDKNLQDYREDIPQLFYYNLFVGISNGHQTRLGSFNAPWEHFFSWTKLKDNVEDKTQDTLLQLENKSIHEKPRLSLQILCEGLCRKTNLIDYFENFVLYHRKRTKIIAKNHQFLGVNRAIENLKNSEDTKLGVFWHTQGSGKSYSMIFFSKKINRKVEGNWSFLIITDRNDLDDQIFKNFVDTQTLNLSTNQNMKNNEYRAKGNKSRVQLEEALSQNKSFYFSTIFNFGLDKGKVYKKKSDRDDWIVIVDEAHRSQYKSLGENMKIALPNAKFIAFTGTPILQNGLTEQWFGNYVSEYNFAQSIEDGATVPLYYRKSVPSVVLENEDLSDEAMEILNQYDLNEEQLDHLNSEYTTLFQAVKRDDRLDEIAKHIVKHFPQRLDVRDDEGKRKPMKAMVISIDKFTAVKMYDKVQLAFKEETKELIRAKNKAKGEEKELIQRKLDFINETKMAVVISQEGTEKQEQEKFAAQGLDITSHRKLMNEPDLDGRDIEDYFKDANNPYRIVFVTAMWMTGFDAPSVSTLYLDKPMKNHTLMQTIARANRVYEAKKNGMIIDYFGVFRNLKKALSDYAEGNTSSEDEANMPVKEFGMLIELLQESINKCKSYLKEFDIDVDKIHEIGEKGFKEIELFKDYADIILKSDDRRKEFNLFVNTIVSLYDSAKPEIYNYPDIKQERDLFTYLKEIVNRKLDRDEEINNARREIDELLDRSVLGNKDLEDDTKITITDYRQINLGEIDFEKLRKEFPKKAYKSIEFTDLKEFMEIKLKQMTARNKTRGNFLEDFEKIIDEYNNGSVEVEEAYETLLKQIEKLNEEEKRYIKEGFSSEEELEIFDLLKKDKLTKDEISKVKKTAKNLLKTLSDKKRELFVYNWYKERQKQSIVEHTIGKVLEELPESYDVKIFREKKEMVFEHIYNLAELGDERFIYESINNSDYAPVLYDLKEAQVKVE
ncbi:deoxyribonuclease [Malaciobacter molluscorum LMG 25693]|uniref:Type I restriction enzyme endonuclease subunit n=1 Tax=Malaciobacter molluscorum LMG 25693 TaxID=870501 RepID=A0A2G1DM09_9BACT|nr:HsdR family type I site-specific deoxyribonuclease [Malaciobacter molluscorum]AXX92185.1 type I restriction/modification system, restriction subunit [Malaciobacter molluscorum LMG 25693]PHO19414.1 deoxyribonuclease [Malaciobacter molluscorum LMG 25693]